MSHQTSLLATCVVVENLDYIFSEPKTHYSNKQKREFLSMFQELLMTTMFRCCKV